jgi:hypothetical protein
MGNWIERGEAAMRGETVDGVELVGAHAASMLDAAGRSALVAPLFAAFMWAAVAFRERVGQPLDPVTLALRLLALALSVRACVLGAMLFGRARTYLQRRRYQLALCDEGLLLRTPRADFAVPKQEIVEIRERGLWQEQSANRWADVYLVTKPESGRTHLTIPPLFERTPGALAERLMRWRGPGSESDPAAEPEPVALASKLFDEVARGATPAGVAVIKLGRGWLRRGPFATVLLGLALLTGLFRLSEPLRARVSTIAELVIVLCVVLVPGLWLVLARRRMAPLKGIALLLTPAEALLRRESGVQRTRWSDVAKVEVSTRRAWSILTGPYEARSLTFTLKDHDAIRYAEGLLSVPAEVVAALSEAYRKGVLP